MLDKFVFCGTYLRLTTRNNSFTNKTRRPGYTGPKWQYPYSHISFLRPFLNIFFGRQRVPTHFSLFQSIPTIQASSSLCQPIQVYSSLFQPVPAYSSLFQSILAESSIFKTRHANSGQWQKCHFHKTLECAEICQRKQDQKRGYMFNSAYFRIFLETLDFVEESLHLISADFITF